MNSENQNIISVPISPWNFLAAAYLCYRCNIMLPRCLLQFYGTKTWLIKQWPTDQICSSWSAEPHYYRTLPNSIFSIRLNKTSYKICKNQNQLEKLTKYEPRSNWLVLHYPSNCWWPWKHKPTHIWHWTDQSCINSQLTQIFHNSRTL